MAIVKCGRCGKGYSDRYYPACPQCGGNPDSTPDRRYYPAPSGSAPGEPRQYGAPWSTGHLLVGAVALALIGYGAVKAIRASRPSPQPVAVTAPQGTGAVASSPWADRVEAAVQSMTAGETGANLAEMIVRNLDRGATRAFFNGYGIAKRGREATVSLSIMWFTRHGTAGETGIDWVISEQAGHLRALITSDSASHPDSNDDENAMNQFFRNVVYLNLVRHMSKVPGLVNRRRRPR